MGGAESTQEKFVQEYGKDVLSCADDPSLVSCQRGEAVNRAIAGALAAGGIASLPGGAQIAAGIGGGANALIQYVVDGKVNYTDALIAGWVNVATGNSKLIGTVILNAAGGATSNYIKGDDPLTGAISSGAGASLGYAGGKIIQGPLEKVINPNWKNWEWVAVGMGISKPLPLNPAPAITGNMGASAITESGGKAISQGVEVFKNKGIKK